MFVRIDEVYPSSVVNSDDFLDMNLTLFEPLRHCPLQGRWIRVPLPLNTILCLQPFLFQI